MKIQLLNDFRGSITNERFYVAGEYEVGVDMAPAHAQALVDDGRAIVSEADKPAPKPAAKRSRKAKK